MVDIDISKAKKEIGFAPRFGLELSIEDALKFRNGEITGFE